MKGKLLCRAYFVVDTYFGTPEKPHELAANYEKIFPEIILGYDFNETAGFKKVAHRLKDRFFADGDIEKNPINFGKVVNVNR